MQAKAMQAGQRLGYGCAVLILAQLGVSGAVQASCGSAFCGVNTQWDAQGLWDKPGLRADLRFEYIDQDQPRSGSDKVAVGALPRHHDEVQTINRNWLLNLDYGFDNNWGVTLTLPYMDRSHDHIHNHHGNQIPEAWDFTEAGDVRVLGRYKFDQQPFQSGAAGVKFGLKLPTGDYEVANDDGDLAERTLQPGTGTTDLILGAYYQRPVVGSSLYWFAQTFWQQPLNDRADYRAGYQLAIDGGLQYGLTEHLAGLLQLNIQIKGRDSGTEAEREDSGSQTLSLSPGLSYALTKTARVYGFVQVPLYHYVNGIQLTADQAYMVGATMAF